MEVSLEQSNSCRTLDRVSGLHEFEAHRILNYRNMKVIMLLSVRTGHL